MYTTAAPDRPLFITGDPELLDDVLRLSAAAGVDLEVAADPTAARPNWSRAPLVLVGDDVAESLKRARLRRRAEVVLVGHDLDDVSIWERAVGVGAEHVALLPAAEPWLIARLAEATDLGVRDLIVGVVGGRGGAGASTLAAALAVTALNTDRRTMLIDADPYGGGVDLIFGGERAPGLRWPDIAMATGRIGGGDLCEALPCMGQLAVLSWDRGDPLDLPESAMSSVLGAATRVCDLVVVDLSRRFDEAMQVVLATADVVLLVVPAEIRATASAARIATAVTRLADDVRVVVRGPAPGGLLAIDVATTLGLPLAGYLKAEPALAARLERGEVPGGRGRGPLTDFCRHFLAELRQPGTAVVGAADAAAAAAGDGWW